MTKARDVASAINGTTAGIPFRVATGTTTAIVAGSTYYTITLPTGRFTQPPIITAISNNPSSYGQTIVVTGITTTSFLVASNVFNYVTAWVATQMTPGSASG